MSKSRDAWEAYQNDDLEGGTKVHEKSHIEAEPWHDIGTGEHIKG